MALRPGGRGARPGPAIGKDRIRGAGATGHSSAHGCDPPADSGGRTKQGDKAMKSWTFQRKLVTGFGVMVGLLVLAAVIAVYALHTAVAMKDGVISMNAESLVDAARLDAAVNRGVAAFRGYM